MKEYILPLRDLIVHPGLTIPVYIDNPLSIKCIETAAALNQKIILTAQHTWNYPLAAADVFTTGTLGDVAQMLRMPDGALHCIVHTKSAVNLSDITVENGLFSGTFEPIEMTDDARDDKIVALREKISAMANELSAARKIKMDKLRGVIQNYPLPAFIDAMIQMFDVDTQTAVSILSKDSWNDKLLLLLEQIALMTETMKIEANINRRVHAQLEGGRRDAILQEKIRAIQRELGEEDDMDVDSVRTKINESKMPEAVKEKAISDWKRMKSLNPMSNEGGLLKAYLDELLSMPWDKSDKSQIDLNIARSILNSQHSGMENVKTRILEHIAVMKKTGKNTGSILCFVGHPGVGKTSLCKSIADALGRKYARISLGGISDESHFRGHRKTYIASQPGRIMDALKRAHANNPVIVLDEIDKMGRDHRGDPESALLEILDPEQNKAFRDHYLEADFDLSNVLFIATANSLNMSPALKDRMEIIEIPGYSEDEKLQIAREHLLARSARDTGWAMDNIVISDEGLRHIIRNYTSEAGVRELQREITALLRRTLLENDGMDIKTEFTIEKIDELLSYRKSIGLSKKIGFSSVLG